MDLGKLYFGHIHTPILKQTIICNYHNNSFTEVYVDFDHEPRSIVFLLHLDIISYDFIKHHKNKL